MIHNVQTILNKVCDDKKQNQNSLNIEKPISCDTYNCDTNSQKSRNITEIISHDKSDLNVLLNVKNIFDVNNYMSDDSLVVSDGSSTDFNFQSVIANAEFESTYNIDLKILLIQWILKFQIPHIAVNNLLQILTPLHLELPLDIRTLLKTPVSLATKKLENGEYCHIGIKNRLQNVISSKKYFLSNIVQLSFNIDGVPLFSSSNIQFWPISCLIKSFEVNHSL